MYVEIGIDKQSHGYVFQVIFCTDTDNRNGCRTDGGSELNFGICRGQVGLFERFAFSRREEKAVFIDHRLPVACDRAAVVQCREEIGQQAVIACL